MAKTVALVEIVTQIDTSGFDQGAKHISRAVEDIGKSAMEMNSALIASCSYVDMLLNAFNGLDYARSLTASLGLEMAALGNVINDSAIAAASLGIAIGGIVSKAEGLERVADAMRDIRGAGVFMAGNPFAPPPFLEIAPKKEIGLGPWPKAGLGSVAALATPLPPVQAGAAGMLVVDALAVGLAEKEYNERLESALRGYYETRQEFLKADSAQLEIEADALRTQIKEKKQALGNIGAQFKETEQNMLGKIDAAGPTDPNNFYTFMDQGEISMAAKIAEETKYEITKQLEVLNARAAAIKYLQDNLPLEPERTPRPSGGLKEQGKGRGGEAFLKQLQLYQDKLAAEKEEQRKYQEKLEQERSNYETQASLMWQNSRGMLSNTDTLAGLRDMFSSQQAALLAGGIDAANPANWTPVMRSNYDQQIQVITKELNPALESMRAQYENNGLAVEDYQTKLAGLKETHTGYPEILQLVEAEERRLAETERLSAESKGRTATILQQAYDNTQRQLDDLAGNTLVQLGDSFAAAIVKGESLGDSLKKLGDDILYLVARAMMLKMLNGIFGSLFGGGGSPIPTPFTGSIPYTGWISDGTAFAKGGIVGQPTLFGFARGIGLMGEAGPEAIMPLGRDGRGNLGVRIAEGAMYGAGAASGVFAPHIEINIENSGGGDMTDEQARALGTQINAAVEMQVAKQMYDYARSGIFRSGAGRGY